MRVVRVSVFLRPLPVVFLLFLGQALLWFFFMPDVPTIPGAAPRYASRDALLKWAMLFVILVSGITIGAYSLPALRRGVPSEGNFIQDRVRLLWRWVYISLAFVVLGELVYIRQIFQDPTLLIEAHEAQNLAILGEAVRAQRVLGVSSLNNLFLFPVAILATLSFHPVLNHRERNRAFLWLLVIGFFVLLHAFFLAARMFFVYYGLTVLAAYLVLQGHRKIRMRVLFVLLFLMLSLVWLGESFRGGWAYARLAQLPWYSAEVQGYVLDRMIQGYLAADFNNALIVLDCPPSMSLFSTTALSFLLPEKPRYSECPSWKSDYGTVNALALLWYDWGWFAFPLVWIIGWAIGLAYRLSRTVWVLSPVGFLYLLVYPGLFSMTRINYFSLSIFLIPFLFWYFYLLLFSLKQTTFRHKQNGLREAE